MNIRSNDQSKRIWRVPAYLPYLQPDLTDKALAEAEQILGYSLPKDFINLLREQNGGYIRYALSDMPHQLIKGIGPNFPSLTDFDWSEEQEYVSFPLDGLVPFDGDGHWHICLDYRESAEAPSVAYVDVERDSSSIIAPSFSAYLSLLETAYSDQFVLQPLGDIDGFISRLSSALDCEFLDPDSLAHGYPVYRARLGGPASSEWIWLSPNRAPRGFVRSDDPRYEQLRNVLPGHGLRFDELPEASYLMGATEGQRDHVQRAVETLGYVLQPLHGYVDDNPKS